MSIVSVLTRRQTVLPFRLLFGEVLRVSRGLFRRQTKHVIVNKLVIHLSPSWLRLVPTNDPIKSNEMGWPEQI